MEASEQQVDAVVMLLADAEKRRRFDDGGHRGLALVGWMTATGRGEARRHRWWRGRAGRWRRRAGAPGRRHRHRGRGVGAPSAGRQSGGGEDGAALVWRWSAGVRRGGSAMVSGASVAGRETRESGGVRAWGSPGGAGGRGWGSSDVGRGAGE